jgi:V8-like Glu-specific endopeptidase
MATKAKKNNILHPQPEIAQRPAVDRPRNIHIGQKHGLVELEELNKVAAGASTTKGFRPDNIQLAIQPATENWTSREKKHLANMPKTTDRAMKALQVVMDRVIVSNPNAYPWCTIGKVFVGWNSNLNNTMWTGTGVLVGHNILLTASHVAPWDKPGWWMRFVPAYDNGNEPFGHSYVAGFHGPKNVSNVEGLDYVVCQLYTPLGNTVGWMGTQSYGSDGSYEGRDWTSVGYPGNSLNAQVPMVEFNVGVNDVDGDGDGKKLETNNLFSSPGWSGGPLWGFLGPDRGSDPRVVGVMSGWEKETFLWWTIEEDDVSAGGNHMVNIVIWAQQNY